MPTAPKIFVSEGASVDWAALKITMVDMFSLREFNTMYRINGFQKSTFLSFWKTYLHFSEHVTRLRKMIIRQTTITTNTMPKDARISVDPKFAKISFLEPSRSSPTTSSVTVFFSEFIPKRRKIFPPISKSSRNSPSEILRSSWSKNFITLGYLIFQVAIYTKNCRVKMRIHIENSVFLKKKRRIISQMASPIPTLLAVAAWLTSSSNSYSVYCGCTLTVSCSNSRSITFLVSASTKS